jgi:hypothetical protein
VAHIARTEANAIVHQDMTTVIATGTGTTGIATEKGIVVTGIVMEAGGMTDVSPLARDTVVALEIMMTIRDVLPIMKMTVAGTSVVPVMKTVAGFAEGEALPGRNPRETEIAVDEENNRTRKG